MMDWKKSLRRAMVSNSVRSVEEGLAKRDFSLIFSDMVVLCGSRRSL